MSQTIVRPIDHFHCWLPHWVGGWGGGNLIHFHTAINVQKRATVLTVASRFLVTWPQIHFLLSDWTLDRRQSLITISSSSYSCSDSCSWSTPSVQFSSVPWPLGSSREDMRDDSAEIFFQSSLREASVSSSGTGRDVHPLTLSIQRLWSDPSK